MKLKYTLATLPQIRQQYIAIVRVMHGDADHHEDFKHKLDDETAVKAFIEAFGKMPEDNTGEFYREWCDQTFGECVVPGDITCEDYVAAIQEMHITYYDHTGARFIVTTVKS